MSCSGTAFKFKYGTNRIQAAGAPLFERAIYIRSARMQHVNSKPRAFTFFHRPKLYIHTHIYLSESGRWATWEFNYSAALSIINDLLFRMSLKSSQLSLEKIFAPQLNFISGCARTTHTRSAIDHRPVNLHLNYAPGFVVDWHLKRALA